MKTQTYGYSEKVLEIFRHPKNIGEIKNPDGVGKVGNPMCLLPETMVHANNDLIDIESLTNNEKVLGHNGLFNSISRTISRNYSGHVVTLKNKFGAVTLTPEHEVLSIIVPKGDKYKRYKSKRTLLVDWNHAAELKKGDILLYPVLKETDDKEFIEVPTEKKKWDFKSIKIPERIRVDSDFLRFCGYYLAEGSLRNKVTRTDINFAFHIKEMNLAKDVQEISKKVFGITAKIKAVEERKTLIVAINNVFVVRLIKLLFGKGAPNKKIPHWMMLLPAEKQRDIICGMWKGDGYFNPKKSRAGYSTISFQLAHQLKTLLLRQRIAPSIYVEDEIVSKDGVKHKKSYRLHIDEKVYLERLANILGIEFNPMRPETVSSWFDDRYFYMPIKNVEKINYNGEVYNIETDESKSYVTESATVHNCGDLMWMYLRIVKNRKSEEYIKDVKVKTFGCVAAVATSSVLTEIVKGMTLKKALAIDKMKIVKKLHGLPQIKIHCSVLSADALKEAIYDYYKKKGRKIPKDLQLVHERNERVREGVEHMH